MLGRIKCPVCQTEIPDETHVPCPVCEWSYVGIEEVIPEDEKECFNGISLKEAKALYAKGLTKYGEPIRKKK